MIIFPDRRVTTRSDGGSGNDNMYGGAGNDTYYVDNTLDTVNESSAADGGYDTVRSTITYTLGNYQERLYLDGTAAINGYGNALDNSITGNGANNSLSGA